MIHISFLALASTVALVANPFVPSARAQPISADALTKASNNCLTTVANTVGIPRANLKVIRQTSDASGISVDVNVPKATASWGCLTNRQGKVEDVYFKGSEGAL